MVRLGEVMPAQGTARLPPTRVVGADLAQTSAHAAVCAALPMSYQARRFGQPTQTT